jgi:hypothetical protein
MTFCWQFLTVHYNYHGNWAGLFCTGDLFPLPPQLESEHVYRFLRFGPQAMKIVHEMLS